MREPITPRRTQRAHEIICVICLQSKFVCSYSHDGVSVIALQEGVPTIQCISGYPRWCDVYFPLGLGGGWKRSVAPVLSRNTKCSCRISHSQSGYIFPRLSAAIGSQCEEDLTIPGLLVFDPNHVNVYRSQLLL